MSGGGFIQTIDIADDGTIVCTYDGGNCYIKYPDATQWENLFAQDKIPQGGTQGIWGQGVIGGTQVQGINSPSMAIAPSDSDYIYAVARTRNIAGDDFGDNGPTKIWRSTNGGASWTDTGKYCGLTTSALRGQGRTMRVDPINRLHVLISDDAGTIWRTTDGFATITCLMAAGQALVGVLPSATTTGTTATGGTTLTFGSGTIPAAVTSPTSGYGRWISNTTDNAAITLSAPVASTTSTTVVSSRLMTGTGVEIGDLISFGMRGCIAFDRDSAVVGGITQGIYIGWGYGASAVYASTDGGATFSAMSGSPDKVFFLECSHDGVLYVLPYTGTNTPTLNLPWRYDGSWTQLTNMSTISAGNNWASVSPDPNNAGHVAFIRQSGGIQFSTNYGTSAAYTPVTNTHDANYNGIGYPRTDTECPAMGAFRIPDGVSPHQGTVENSMTHGQAMFDPNESGRLWITEGIGVWYCSPPTSGTNVVVPFTGFNKNQQSIILNQMIKAPGGTLMASSQDRGGYLFEDPTVEPGGDFGFFTSGNSTVVHAWGIDYAKDDVDFLVLAVTGNVRKSTNGGLSWTTAGSLAAQGAIAVQTSQNFVVFPNNGDNATYTTDGGSTFNNCLFNGSPIAGNQGWGNNNLNRHMVCADLVDATTYYAYNYVNAPTGSDANGGIWRSTDSGATWTQMCTKLEHPTVALRYMTTGAVDFGLSAVQGHEGHLIISPGSGYNQGFPMMFSKDAGVTWSAVGGTGVTWTACSGKELPGESYPALYHTGFNEDDADPDDAGVFVCTDFDPDNPGDATWTRICRAPAGNMERPRDLVADKDTYGRWYMPNGGTGYVYGEFRQYGALR
jgi:hypothetical protein